MTTPSLACSSTPPNPPNVWTRVRSDCYDYENGNYTSFDINMRRKAEILKHKGNQNKLSKKQQYSKIINGHGSSRKKVWANQTDLVTNPNVNNVGTRSGNTIVLSDCSNNIPTPSSHSDVPGDILLYYDKSVPLIGYQQQRRTFLAGGSKWPRVSGFIQR